MLRDEIVWLVSLLCEGLTLITITRASKILINSSKGIFQLKTLKILTKLYLISMKILKIICLRTHCILFLHVMILIYA